MIQWCFGDSLTRGTPGFGYLKYVSGKKRYKNYGLPGDCVRGICDRLREELAHPTTSKDADVIILCMGGNDIVMPYLASISPVCKAEYDNIDALMPGGYQLCKSAEDYEGYLDDIIDHVHTYGKRMIVIGPAIIETPARELDAMAGQWNDAAKKICQAKGEIFIDIRAWQHAERERMIAAGEPVDEESAAAATELFGTLVSKGGPLYVTVDGLHMNIRSAQALAKAVEAELAKIAEERAE